MHSQILAVRLVCDFMILLLFWQKPFCWPALAPEPDVGIIMQPQYEKKRKGKKSCSYAHFQNSGAYLLALCYHTKVLCVNKKQKIHKELKIFIQNIKNGGVSLSKKTVFCLGTLLLVRVLP